MDLLTWINARPDATRRVEGCVYARRGCWIMVVAKEALFMEVTAFPSVADAESALEVWSVRDRPQVHVRQKVEVTDGVT